MLAITRPLTEPYYEHSLTLRLFQKGHYLLRSYTPWPSRFVWPSSKPWTNHRILVKGKIGPSALIIHQLMSAVAINSMREIIRNLDYGGFSSSNNFSKRETRNLFASSLKTSMELMQQQLEALTPHSKVHNAYVEFCQSVVKYIRSLASDIRPVADFFLRSSEHYWPEEDDPNLYASSITSYSLRLKDNPSRTSSELFHFLYRGWKNDMVHSRPQNHTMSVLKGMKHWEFTEFMLSNFIPAILRVGFDTPGASVLPKTYLPTVAKRVPRFLAKSGPEAGLTFKYLINILKIITNYVTSQTIDEWSDMNEVHRTHRGIFSVVCQFWISIIPALREYIGLHPEYSSIMGEITIPMNKFALGALHYFTTGVAGSWSADLLNITDGDSVKRFIVALQDDIQAYWRVYEGEIFIRANGARTNDDGGVKMSLKEGILPLFEVLSVGLPYFEEAGTLHIRSVRSLGQLVPGSSHATFQAHF
jgi:hypothetical protein